MEKILKQFTKKSLYDATSALMEKLQIKLDRETAEIIPKDAFWPGEQSLYLAEALNCIENIYFIGFVNDQSLQDEKESISLDDVKKTVERDGKYNGMAIFACDAKPEANLTRTIIANLTRAFNRLASACPVILLVRQDEQLSISTCERTDYVQRHRIGTGEKLGKVNILRNINCDHPHRGHVDILKKLEIDNKDVKTFDKLYEQWKNVFDSEILTKEFYTKLYHWYQWAVEPTTGIHFPYQPQGENDHLGDISIQVIRLITRLLFVWFIKQKGLIPDEIFSTDKLQHDILKDFNPKATDKGEYYNAILQNLFFATLNNEIGSRGNIKKAYKGVSSSYGVKTLYRDNEKKSWFRDDVDLSKLFYSVPYMNCGLFECLEKSDIDKKSDTLLDGFSSVDSIDRRAFIPNSLFFADEHKETVTVEEKGKGKDKGKIITKKVDVNVKGIIRLFQEYYFTVEENTPSDIDVSLDPELLGRVFENLLATYNPETKENANERKSTGSFYTPRPIVEYMVNESLVQYLKTKVVGGEGLEDEFRKLISYDEKEINLTEEQKKDILLCLYRCKILDPACGSGAFPMGMLQQMVHIMRQLDKDNSIWHEVVLEEAKRESHNALNEKDKAAQEKRLTEICEDFSNDLTYPDYKRKLHLIKNCIYGVDIQPIAVMISKLRFFISLICEQEVDKNAPEKNYGINTLPNLETKFVAANTLIPASIRSLETDWTQDEHLTKLKDELLDIRLRHFLVKTQASKLANLEEDAKKSEEIRKYILETSVKPDEKRIEENKALIEQYKTELAEITGEDWVEHVEVDLFGGPKVVRCDRNKNKRGSLKNQISACESIIHYEENKKSSDAFVSAVNELTEWNPYNQTDARPFFDPEWMYGVKGGFDVVIGNPPYVETKKGLYSGYSWDTNLYKMFMEVSFKRFIQNEAVLSFITPKFYLLNKDDAVQRDFFLDKVDIKLLALCNPFNAVTENVITIAINRNPTSDIIVNYKHQPEDGSFFKQFDVEKAYCKTNAYHEIILGNDPKIINILVKMSQGNSTLKDISVSKRGAEVSKNFLRDNVAGMKALIGDDMKKYCIQWDNTYLPYSHKEYKRLSSFFSESLILLRRVDSCLEATISTEGCFAFNKNVYGIHIDRSSKYNPKFILGWINSKVVDFYYKKKFSTKKDGAFPEIQSYLYEQLPLPVVSERTENEVIKMVDYALKKPNETTIRNVDQSINMIIYHLYNLTYDEVLVIDPSTPITRKEYDDFQID